MNKTSIVFLLFLLLLNLSCNKDELSPDEQAVITNPTTFVDASTDPPSNECSEGCTEEHFGEVMGVIAGVVKNGVNKANLEDVEVNLEGRIFTTFEAGAFAFNSLAIGKPVLLSFIHPDFIPSSIEVMINYGTANFVEKIMTPVGSKKVFSEGETIILSDRLAVIRAIELMTEGGTVSAGSISTAMSYLGLQTEEEVTSFPGHFEGKTNNDEAVPMVVAGMVSMGFSDSEGNKLELAKEAELVFPSNSIIEGTPSTIQTWFFDKNSGEWREDGYADRQSDGSYLASVDKAGTWALAQPMDEEMAYLESGIIMETSDGPHAGESWVRLHAQDRGWRGRAGYTDSSGQFIIPVYPNKEYTLHGTATFEAKTGSDGKIYYGKYNAKSSFKLPVLDPGEISDEK